MESSDIAAPHEPWNKGLIVGQKAEVEVDPVRWTVSGLLLKPSMTHGQHAVGHARRH